MVRSKCTRGGCELAHVLLAGAVLLVVAAPPALDIADLRKKETYSGSRLKVKRTCNWRQMGIRVICFKYGRHFQAYSPP
jgi:hypothetical protein